MKRTVFSILAAVSFLGGFFVFQAPAAAVSEYSPEGFTPPGEIQAENLDPGESIQAVSPDTPTGPEVEFQAQNPVEELKPRLESLLQEQTSSSLQETIRAEGQERQQRPLEQKRVLSLTLPEAQKLALENSRKAQRARLGLEQLDIAVEMAREQHEEIEELEEVTDDLQSELERERADLRADIDEIHHVQLPDAIDELAEALEEALPEDPAPPEDPENDNEDGDNNNNDDNQNEEPDNENNNNGNSNGNDQNNDNNDENNNENENENNGNNENNSEENDFPADDIIWEVTPQLTRVLDLLTQLTQFQQQLAMVELALEGLDEVEDVEVLDDLVAESEQSKREMKQERDLARLEWEKNKKLIQFGAEAQYIGLLSLEEQMELEKAGLKMAQNELEKEQAKREQGTSLDLQVEAQKLEVQELQDELDSLENDYDNQVNDFLDLLGKRGEYSEVELEQPSFHLDLFQVRFDQDDASEKALEEGKEMEIAQESLDNARDNERWAADQHGRGSSEHELAETEVEEAIIQLEEVEETTPIRLQEAKHEFEESLQEQDNANEALELAEEMLKSQQRQQELGLAMESDVIQAQGEKYQAQSAVSLLEYQGYLAKQRLNLLQEGIMPENE